MANALLTRTLAVVAVAAGVLGCNDRTQFRPVEDAGLCGEHERRIDGACVFVCERDVHCPDGERCNLLTGTCEAKPETPAESALLPCTTGAVRCNLDQSAVERCNDEGTWELEAACPEPHGYCLNARCVACQPGTTWCDPARPGLVTACLEDGSDTREVACAPNATCQAGECRECSPDESRCSPDRTTLQSCQKSDDLGRTWGWENRGDGFDGSCITQVCEQPAGEAARCKAPACFPGTTQCASSQVVQVCNERGAFVDQACSSIPGMSPQAECRNGVCVDECYEAAQAKSYFGCEYWGSVQDNPIDTLFKKNNSTSPTQGTVDSEYALVVTNRSALPATVEVFRWYNGAEQRVKSVTLPGRDDAATQGLAVIKLPWQSIIAPNQGSMGDTEGITGQMRHAYRLTSTRPVTVYQFNPLNALTASDRACFGAEGRSDLACNETSQGGICKTVNGAKRCHYYTYSNDASLLLPSHILGTSHVAVTYGHANQFNGFSAGFPIPGHITIIGTHDNTQVTVKSSAVTLASPSGYRPAIPALSKGGRETFTLNRYDVLQLTSAQAGSKLDCGGFGLGEVCRLDNDLTGTVVTSSHPVAVFGGSPCAQTPVYKAACDHIEEQVFPFATWGKRFIAQKSQPVRVTSGGFATPANAAPDHWKVVASCPTSQCQTGTLVTLSSPPAAADVLPPNRCLNGTSLALNNCRLPGGASMEFRSKASFTITADQPIAVAQFFAGQSATPSADTGDPSFILLPPVEQWRNNYTVLAAPGIRDNYLGLAVEADKVDSVWVDGKQVAGFVGIPGTSFIVVNHPVSVGTHTIEVVPKPGLNELPGAGVTVYGFDSYVSYGYTGGLDLGSIVSGINPGG